MDELESIKQRLRDAPLGDPPAPWGRVGAVGVVGITEVGFAEDSELLLVLSGHGREVIDCRTGGRAARDYEMGHRSSWYGHHELIGLGFGPLANRQVRLAGAFGGGLLTVARDGWGAVRVPVDWPDEFLLLTSPFSSIHHPSAPFWKLLASRDSVAWGFSYTGQSLIAATTEGVTIFRRI
ncbi:MAG TPA: hypothetical protein VFC78_04635 [Tepidisphaeraceae bacterium]|nr:hypothetical protein [Tepidisphaeraceae bacterium]